MSNFKLPKALAPAIDAALLTAWLKLEFILAPAARSETAMLLAAVLVHLIVVGRNERYARRALVSALGILCLYFFYWKRPVDVLVLPLWWISLFGWRLILRDGFERWTMWMWRFRDVMGHFGAAFLSRWRRLVAWTGMRYVRVVIVGVLGLLLMWPYISAGTVGAGDSYWYALSVADFVVQMRAGQFPVWLAQSDFAFYGGALPLRYAPYLQHLSGVLDLLTGQQLPPYAVLNLSLVITLLAAVWIAQYCLGRLAPQHPWKVMALAMCYGLCPGVLGLAYAQDLCMTFSALPFLPIVFWGMVRAHNGNDMGARYLMVGGLAAAWLAHPPIAMWCGIVATTVQVTRIIRARKWETWRMDLTAAGWLVGLAGYTVVSVKALGPQWSADASTESLYYFLRVAFPANWLPLHPLTRALDNLQVGYGLAALGVFLASQARGKEMSLARLLLMIVAGFLILLTPVPLLSEALWRLVPQVVLNITNIWPAQRLLPLLALCVLFASVIWLGSPRHGGRPTIIFNLLLGGALLWGGLEAEKFVILPLRDGQGWKQAARKYLPENRGMPYPSLGPHPIRPRYFSDGVTDVELEHRFLAVDTKEVIRHATDAILPGFGPGTAATAPALPRRLSFETGKSNAPLPLEPEFTLEPGRHYLIGLRFLDRDYKGALLMEGRNFWRIYGLPTSGAERAFGAGPLNARWLALWQTGSQPEKVRLTWLPATSEPPAELSRPFAEFVWREYRREELDVQLETLLPYRARVRSPKPCYLETPRLFVPNYRALLNGATVPVEQSPDGFVMIKIGSGDHILELQYSPPWPVKAAYYGGVLAWGMFLAVSIRHAYRVSRSAGRV